MPMSAILKKTIACIVTLVCIALFVLGAYLPLRKSQMYIVAYGALSKVRSLDDFNRTFDPVISYYSPIGQEELVSAYLGIIVDAVSRDPGPDKAIADVLIKNAEAKAKPILADAPSFSYSQTILKLAALNKVAAGRYKDETYYKRAVELFKMGLVYSPNRPAFLYNLLDLYLSHNDAGGMKETAQVILKYWPNDKNIQGIWEALQK